MKSPLGLEANLPVMDIIRESLGLLWQKRELVLRMFLPALFILALVDWVASAFIDERSLLQLGFALASLILAVLFATAAHRFTLLPPEQWYASALHAWKGEEFRYLLRIIQIVLCAFAVIFALVMVLLVVLGKEMAPLAGVAGILPGFYIWGRLSVTLPEIALGQRTTLKRAWQLSAGNGSRLVLVVVVVPVLLMLPFIALYAADSLLLNYVAAFGSYITSLISLVMLSLSYRFLLDFYDGGDESRQLPEDETAADQNSGFDA